MFAVYQDCTISYSVAQLVVSNFTSYEAPVLSDLTSLKLRFCSSFKVEAMVKFLDIITLPGLQSLTMQHYYDSDAGGVIANHRWSSNQLPRLIFPLLRSHYNLRPSMFLDPHR